MQNSHKMKPSSLVMWNGRPIWFGFIECNDDLTGCIGLQSQLRQNQQRHNFIHARSINTATDIFYSLFIVNCVLLAFN